GLDEIPLLTGQVREVPPSPRHWSTVDLSTPSTRQYADYDQLLKYVLNSYDQLLPFTWLINDIFRAGLVAVTPPDQAHESTPG
ncbi:hypothetical protein, partial [Acrocarpospora phusangensis]|uniref:hypothetical protein n=1 Tax=Acrocarpospora phusangensis TaxID=1070424 RepID=UPI001950840E